MKYNLNDFEDYDFKSYNFEDKEKEYMSKKYLTKIVIIDISYIVNNEDYTILGLYNNLKTLIDQYGEKAEIFFDKYYKNHHYDAILEIKRFETDEEHKERIEFINSIKNKEKKIKEQTKIKREIKEKKLLKQLAEKFKVKIIE